jgi:phospholipase/lecithinase/hemolysin
MVRPEPGTLHDATRHAEAVANRGIDTSNPKALATMRNALISLENAAEEARKQIIEPALDDEIDVGDTVAGVQRLEAERPTVTDSAAALEMLEDAGADPAAVVRIHPNQFVDAVDGTGIDPSVLIDHEEYTFYRRNG